MASARNGRWVALKIAVAAAIDTEACRELSVLQKLEEAGVKYIVKLLDLFVHQGPGLRFTSCTTNIHLHPEIILRVTRQLLEALAGMHRAGYAHRGSCLCPLGLFPRQEDMLKVILADISGANVAFTARGLERLSEEEMFEVIGAPKTAELVRSGRRTRPPGRIFRLAGARKDIYGEIRLQG